MIKATLSDSDSKRTAPQRLLLSNINEGSGKEVSLTTIGNNTVVLTAVEFIAMMKSLENKQTAINEWLEKTIGASMVLKTNSK